MQAVDSVYRQLINSGEYTVETLVTINGVDYGEDVLKSVKLKSRVFADDGLSIGGALEGSVTIVLRCPPGTTAREFSTTIPKAAEIGVYQRLTGDVETAESSHQSAVVNSSSSTVGAVAGLAVVGERTGPLVQAHSDWLIQGVYNIDQRDATIDYQLTITGIDKMAFAEADYPGSSLSWPARDEDVVREIANAMGVQVTEETWGVLVLNRQVNLPLDYTMREVLGHIAAAYCGNFIMTKSGKLHLLQFIDLKKSPSNVNKNLMF